MCRKQRSSQEWGAAYAAGISIGFYDREKLFEKPKGTTYDARMRKAERDALYFGWKSEDLTKQKG